MSSQVYGRIDQTRDDVAQDATKQLLMPTCVRKCPIFPDEKKGGARHTKSHQILRPAVPNLARNVEKDCSLGSVRNPPKFGWRLAAVM